MTLKRHRNPALIRFISNTVHRLQNNIIHKSVSVSLCICVFVFYVHVYVSDGAHVFMRSCAPVQLVTLAQRVALRNAADVQMFLLEKQTEQRPFSSGQRDCQNKSCPPLDLSPNSDSLIHRQITARSLKNVVALYFTGY